MFIGSRPATAGVQVVALLLSILGGLIGFGYFGGALLAVLGSGGTLLLFWVGIAACAYYLAAPAAWLGLLRRFVALVVGFADGLVVFYVVVDLMPFQVPGYFGLFVMTVAVVWSVYLLASPDSWRGLWRRALRVLGVGLALYAALGYLFAFVGLSQAVQVPMGGMPDQAAPMQVIIVVVAVVALAGSFALREPRRRPAPASVEVPGVTPTAAVDQSSQPPAQQPPAVTIPPPAEPTVPPSPEPSRPS